MSGQLGHESEPENCGLCQHLHATGRLRLYSVGDVAATIGVSRQRVYELWDRGELPKPLSGTRAGQIWDANVVDAWAATRNRRPGRSRKREDT